MGPRLGKGAYEQVSSKDDPFVPEKTALDGRYSYKLTDDSRSFRRVLLYRSALAAAFVLLGLAGFIVGSCVTSSLAPSPPASPLPAAPEFPANTISGPTAAIEECGETPDEARARNCRFDTMLQLWVPASCYDEEHSEFYLSTYQWKWYYDGKGQREMPDEVMRRGDHAVAFMSDQYHRRHCAYAWEVATRALRDQRPVLGELLSYKHVHHCNMVFFWPAMDPAKAAQGVETHAGFGRCAPYHVWVAGEMPK